MATMHIKNKYEVSLKELIAGTKQKGGVPDRIDINPQEAWDILKEIQHFGRNSPFSISNYKGHTTGAQFEITSRLINNKAPIEREEAGKLITQWIRGEYQVYLNNIPLHPRPATVKETPAPKRWYKRLFKN